jgi:hypothetical protein
MPLVLLITQGRRFESYPTPGKAGTVSLRARPVSYPAVTDSVTCSPLSYRLTSTDSFPEGQRGLLKVVATGRCQIRDSALEVHPRPPARA